MSMVINGGLFPSNFWYFLMVVRSLVQTHTSNSRNRCWLWWDASNICRVYAVVLSRASVPHDSWWSHSNHIIHPSGTHPQRREHCKSSSAFTHGHLHADSHRIRMQMPINTSNSAPCFHVRARLWEGTRRERRRAMRNAARDR